MNQFLFVLALVGTTMTMPIADNSEANYTSIAKSVETPAITISAESSEINPSISAKIPSEGQIFQKLWKKLEKNEELAEQSEDEEEKQEDKRDISASENVPLAIPKPSSNSGQLSDIASQLPVIENMKFESSATPFDIEKPLALPTLETENSVETLPVAQSVVKPKNDTLDQTPVELKKEITHVPQNIEVKASAETDNLKQIKLNKIVDDLSEVLLKSNEEKNLEQVVAQKVTSDENIVENKNEDKKDAIKQEEEKEEPIERATTEAPQRVVRETEISEEKSKSKAEEKNPEKEKPKSDRDVSTDSSSQDFKQEEKAQEESKEENNKSTESESSEKHEAVVQEVPVKKLEAIIIVENKKNDSSSSSSESF